MSLTYWIRHDWTTNAYLAPSSTVKKFVFIFNKLDGIASQLWLRTRLVGLLEQYRANGKTVELYTHDNPFDHVFRAADPHLGGLATGGGLGTTITKYICLRA